MMTCRAWRIAIDSKKRLSISVTFAGWNSEALFEAFAVFDRATRFVLQLLGSGYEFPGVPDHRERIFDGHGYILWEQYSTINCLTARHIAGGARSPCPANENAPTGGLGHRDIGVAAEPRIGGEDYPRA